MSNLPKLPRNLSPIQFLTPVDQEMVLANSTTIKKDAGSKLVHSGDFAENIFIPLSGRLKSSLGGIEEELPEGEALGLLQILEVAPFENDITCETAVEYLCVPAKIIKPYLDQLPGFRTYLRNISEHSLLKSLDATLSDLSCTPLFRVSLIGHMAFENVPREKWLAQEGDYAGDATYLISGTVRAYTSGEDKTRHALRTISENSWLMWDEALNKKKYTYSLKTNSRVELFRLPSSSIENLAKNEVQSLEKYNTYLKNSSEIFETVENPDQEIKSLDDLFPQSPRPRRLSRFTYPIIRQNDEMDCGPACLAMISKFHGNEFPVRFWRGRMEVNQEGTSLFDLAKAAETVGLVAHGLQIESLLDMDSNRFPLIALRNNHFVVVYACTDKGLTIGDPAIGLRTMTNQEFAEGFDGYVVAMAPTEEFFNKPRPKSKYLHFLKLFDGHFFEIGIIFVTGLIMAGFSTIPAFVSQFIIDDVLTKKDTSLLAIGITAAFAVTIMVNATYWVQGYYISYLSSRFDFAAASSFMRKLLSLNYKFFATRHIGDFLHRLSEMQRVREFFTNDLISTVLSLLNLFFYGVVLFFYSPKVAVAVLLTAPLLVAISAIFSRRLVNFFNESFNASAEQDSIVSEHIKGIATIKTLGAEVATRWRFEEILVRSLRARYSLQVSSSTIAATSSMASSAIDYAVMALAAYMSIQGEMTTGQVISVTIIAAGVIGPFQNLAGMWSQVMEFQAVLDRLNDVFLAESEDAREGHAIVKEKLQGEIEFRDVWFRYGGESSDWVLKGVSFRIMPGQHVALVGASGSGKSTVALLAARLYEPTRGTILIDGIDYKRYERNWLRKRVGILLQETNLFHGSILENIAWADARPDMARVELAAAAANATEFILDKAQGFEYKITHGGQGLSGGQKQRIGIARMIYYDPSILFMDEATSSLDSASERAISKALEVVATGRAVISIAHRYETIKNADFAIVMSEGKIVETGPDKTLVALKGHYAQLFATEKGP